MKTHDAPRHAGISMHKITVGAGEAGAIVVIGYLVMGFVGVPVARWVLIFSLIVGAIAAAGLTAWHRRHPIKLPSIR
jgi:hypothetical protein